MVRFGLLRDEYRLMPCSPSSAWSLSSPSPPSMPAGAFSEAARRSSVRGAGNDFNWAPFDEQRLSVDQSVGNLLVCRFEDSAKRLTGNAHFLRRLGLIKPLEVGQADGLELIDGQYDLLQNRKGDPSGLVIVRLWQLRHASAMSWSRHISCFCKGLMVANVSPTL